MTWMLSTQRCNVKYTSTAFADSLPFNTLKCKTEAVVSADVGCGVVL